MQAIGGVNEKIEGFFDVCGGAGFFCFSGMPHATASCVSLHRRRRASRREFLASRIAVHEAGHAVMAYLCRRRIGGMSAVPHGEILGQVEYRGFTTYPASWLEDARARRKLENEIMISLAGLAAEYVQPGIVDHAGAATDLVRALEIALPAIADPEEATAFINWLFVRARNRLREPACRRAVKQLAGELLRHGSLTGPRVRSVLRRSLG